MKKNILWLMLLLVVWSVGISNVFAAEYQLDYSYVQVYYINNGSSVTAAGQTWLDSLQSYVSNDITTSANSYGAGVAFNSPIPILANHNYSISIYFPNIDNIALSAKNGIAIGNDAFGVSYNYANNDYWVTQNYSNVSNNSIISYNFTAKGAASYIFIPWTTTTSTTQSYFFDTIIIEDLGSEGVSEETINNSINNQTNVLNNYIQSSTNTITGAITDTENNINSNIDDMEQTIVDSNKETQNVIKDQFNSCRDSVNLFKPIETFTRSGITFTNNGDGSYTLNGTATSDTSFFIKGLNYEAGTYTLSLNNELTNDNPSFRVQAEYSGGTIKINFTSSNNTITKSINNPITSIAVVVPSGLTLTNFTFKPQLEKGSTATEYEPFGEEICSNKLDEQNKTSKGILGKLTSLFDWLTNNDSADLSSASNIAGFLPAGPIDSIINLPLTFFQEVNSNLYKTCTPLDVPMPYVNRTIQIPCINTIFNQIEGLPNFWNWTGTIASIIILYRYLIAFYKYYDDLTTLKANIMSDWGEI